MILGSVDNSTSDAQRPATCSRDPVIRLNAQAYCTESDRNGSREQVVGRRNLSTDPIDQLIKQMWGPLLQIKKTRRVLYKII